MSRKFCSLLPATLFIASTVFAETIQIKPIVIQHGVLPRAANIHAISSIEGNAGILSSTELQPNLRSWLQMENGEVVCSRDVPVPARVPVAVDEKRIAWATSSNGVTTLHLLTPQTGINKSFEVSLAGIIQIAIAGSNLFAISVRGDQSMHLHQISMEDGKLSYLSPAALQREAISFGQSTEGRLTLIDNVQGRFREDKITVPYSAGTWKRIESPILDKSRNRPDPQVGTNWTLTLIVQHWLTKSGNHLFVTDQQEYLSRQYAIETNAEGKQVKQFLLENWISRIREAGTKNAAFTIYAGNGVVQFTGDFVAYP